MKSATILNVLYLLMSTENFVIHTIYVYKLHCIVFRALLQQSISTAVKHRNVRPNTMK